MAHTGLYRWRWLRGLPGVPARYGPAIPATLSVWSMLSPDSWTKFWLEALALGQHSEELAVAMEFWSL